MRRREFIAGLGTAAVWPVVARAQQLTMPVIGYLGGTTEGFDAPFRRIVTAFGRGLGEQGYVEGRNVEILYRYADGRNDRLPAMAADLVRRRVSVIYAVSGPAAALAAMAATSTIPIVFRTGADPVELGLVASLNHPGGNITGVTNLSTELAPKRLELLHQMVPSATSIGFLVNPNLPQIEDEERQVEAAARILGVRLVILKASTPSEIEAAFAIIAGQRIGALMASGDPLFFIQRNQLAALAARHAVPAIYSTREIVEAGSLMNYGPSLSDADRLAGTYAGRILKGEKPSELPVQQSTRIEMVINMKTAKSLGLTVPQSILLRADEVIE
jgi:putative tryptophan/tyrosine transport system substrate-binding protein